MSQQVYTQEEIELNRKLYEECLKKEVDFSLVEEYLRQGADPLGPTEVGKWEDEVHLYGELISCLGQDEQTQNLPEITRIFLEFGMDISKPRIPYDYGDSINPMWEFGFFGNRDLFEVLKLLLDSGLTNDIVGDFWRHAIDDWVYVDAINPNTKEDNERVTWIIKMIMLCASYPHIINNDERLRFEICYDLNEYDLTLFKNPDNYEYVYDTRFCEERPYIEECIIRIFEKESKKEVWRMGFTKEINDYLRENPING